MRAPWSVTWRGRRVHWWNGMSNLPMVGASAGSCGNSLLSAARQLPSLNIARSASLTAATPFAVALLRPIP